MTVSVIVPTVDGRDECLARCIAAYEETTPDLELIIVRNKTACGIAWQEGAEQATGDFIHFTADDLWPYPGWWEAAVEVTERGALPAAWVMGDGSQVYCTVPIWEDIHEAPVNVLVPFFSREQFDLGGWVVPIHYGSDDWITFLATKRGIPVELIHEYRFEHTADQNGRLHNNRVKDVPELCRLMHDEWFLPYWYKDVAIALDPSFIPPMPR